MGKARLEAFSDAVIAIILTVMVLEFKAPHTASIESLAPLLPKFLSYLLSFVYLGIYWNNHHHLLHAAQRVSGGMLWANLHLLFWLSLVPFVTSWMGENHFASGPLAVYGFNLLMAAISYYILQTTILRSEGFDSLLAEALGRDLKGKISPILYIVAIVVAPFSRAISGGIYVLVALIWLVPDPRIENALRRHREHPEAHPHLPH
jgi:uncharacterized membrane protein